MQSFEAELFYQAEFRLAEGPIYHRESLWFVDCLNGQLHQLGEEGRLQACYPIGATLGSAAPVEDQPDWWVIAYRDGFALYQLSSAKLHPIANPEPNRACGYFNDGKCDPAGRFWADPGTGKQLTRIPLPLGRPTSCFFGGPDGRTLYITTARAGTPGANAARRLDLCRASAGRRVTCRFLSNGVLHHGRNHRSEWRITFRLTCVLSVSLP